MVWTKSPTFRSVTCAIIWVNKRRKQFEWDAQEQVGAALVQLARQPTVCDIKLEEQVARWQFHFWYFGYVPGVDDQASTMRVFSDLLDNLCNLIGDRIVCP